MSGTGPATVGISECAAAIEEDEDDGWAGDGNQREGGEIGDQMNVDAHGRCALSGGECCHMV